MPVTLNRAGRDNADALIKGGKVDKTTAWTFTAQDGNDLLGKDGNDWAAYGQSHLGTDQSEPFTTKNHWEYPFAKGGTLYRSALIAIRTRAGQQKDKAILEAAGALLDEIDGTTDRTHENQAAAEAAAIVIAARPPRIEIQAPQGSIESSPVRSDVLDRWQAGLRAAADPETNIIQIFDVIGYDFWSGGGITADTTAQQLEQIGPEPVTVQINSPGGDMFEGIAIYEVLRQHPAKVTVQIMGLAASAASIIAMAADDIQMSPAGFIMIHNCWVMAAGNQNDLREVADYLAPFDAAIRDVYASRSGQKTDDITSWMNNDRYLNATDAISLGFADSLLDRAAITEDKNATEAARNQNATRKIESLLHTKGGMSRASARDLIHDLKTGKREAAAKTTDTREAVEDTTREAGVKSGWEAAAKIAAEICA